MFTYNLRFPGQYYDVETGKHYNYYRDYDRSIGRYLQSDPLGVAAGLATFSYVDSDPLTNRDPLGLAKAGKGKWAECTDEDMAYCRQECGSRGVKTCRKWWRIATGVEGGEVVKGWVPALKPSCNCNESCDTGCKTSIFLIGVGVAICVAQPQFIPLFLMGGAAVGAGAR